MPRTRKVQAAAKVMARGAGLVDSNTFAISFITLLQWSMDPRCSSRAKSAGCILEGRSGPAGWLLLQNFAVAVLQWSKHAPAPMRSGREPFVRGLSSGNLIDSKAALIPVEA
jgi:hypothetical protein